MIAIKVPKKEYVRTDPKFLKKGPFYILYPLSKIIGGSNNIIKILVKWLEMCLVTSIIANYFKINPEIIPISVVRPASCKYLWFDLYKKCPLDIANINKNTMHNISVEIIA